MKKNSVLMLLFLINIQYTQTENQFVYLCRKVFTDLSKNTDFLYDFFSDHALEQISKPSKIEVAKDCWWLWFETAASTLRIPDRKTIETEFFKKIGIPSVIIASTGAIVLITALSLHTRKSSTKKLIKPFAIFGGLGMVATAGIHTLANGIKTDRLLRFIR